MPAGSATSRYRRKKSATCSGRRAITQERALPLRGSLAIRRHLAEADPANAGWQHDLAVSYNKIGDVLSAEANLDEALENYQRSRTIADRLAAADAGNIGWQRDLALSHARVGMVFAQQGQGEQAAKAFHTGRRIIAEMAAQSPDNAMLQKDLAWLDGLIERATEPC